MSRPPVVSAQRPAAHIGRFRIVRRLGQGAQGEVSLAEDTRLGRRVALKTIRLGGRSEAEQVARVRALLEEAKIVAQLSHPHIVPLHDAGDEAGAPYLVFEYVEGETLAAHLRAHRRLQPARAADIAAQVLGALAYAHGKGVLHRDIKPANLMLAGDSARLMDFGIARRTDTPGPERSLAGTPAYLAPEYIAGEAFTAAADVFAVGMMLYEMLTGTVAIVGQNLFETLHRQLTEALPAPSQHAGLVDEGLDSIVLKALSKDPGQRYPGAQAMREALLAWLGTGSEPAAAPEDARSTLQFVLRRMRHKSDFPALSGMIGMINRAASSETERVSELSNAILKDFGLTAKLLKLVNTATFGQFSGTISTISRAVVILGFENVRQIAVSLILLEHLQSRSQAVQLRDEMLASYLCGLLGRELVSKAGIRDAEEAFVCSLFHPLGKLLAAYYLHEEFQQIVKLQATQELDEARATMQVLGLSFEDLGMGVARSWGFPERLLHSMRHLETDKAPKPASTEERLRAVASLSSDLCAALREPAPERRRSRLAALNARYETLGVNTQLVQAVAQSATAELARDCAMFGIAPASSPLIGQLQETARRDRRPVSFESTDGLERAVGDARLDTAATAGIGRGVMHGEQRSAILTAGIQDITNSLVGEFQLNDVLRMILETMYRGMGFTRVLLCVRDPASDSLKARFGFGPEIDRVLRRGFQVPLAPSRDAFHAAISNGADIYIADVNGERIRDHIPRWYRETVPALSLALFPVVVNRKPVALFYGDSDRVGELSFDAGELNLLKTLRNQAVLAIKQRP
ncbi:MAG: HDOD domain-containing protein [Burkholderiales bacterium]|nr:HDOD domain-containing protein [Burkholderiales bacterium]